MMEKYIIGIISMQRIYNYGSFMQCLALKRLLEQFNAKVNFIDYHIEHSLKLKRILNNKSLPLKKRLYEYLRFLKHTIIRPSWAKEYALRYEPYYKLLGLKRRKKYRKKVDLLVIGSDLVFDCIQDNYTVGFSRELFGYKSRCKSLCSYAASFGSTNIKDIDFWNIKEKMLTYFNKFNRISVRDENSVNIIKAITGKTPYKHLDPVLIGELENETWEDCPHENFLLVYGYWNRFSNEECKEIEKFANNNSLKIIMLCAKQNLKGEFIICSVGSVLSYFKKAKYVITDTFHGSIFSVILHKQVAIYIRKKGPSELTNEEKLTDLVNTLHLNNSVINGKNLLDSKLKEKIDYTFVDNLRKIEREKSTRYFKELIRDMNNENLR